MSLRVIRGSEGRRGKKETLVVWVRVYEGIFLNPGDLRKSRSRLGMWS